jgi:hypothetical protein
MERDLNLDFPLLMFAAPVASPRQDLHGGAGSLTYPTHNRQRGRLAPQFRQLREQFHAALQEAPLGIDPDLVLVIEVAGSVSEFVRAAQRIPGMEWIGEWSDDELLPDADFHDERIGRDADTITRSFFLMFSNRAALNSMLGLWRAYSRSPEERLPHGLGRWKSVFRQLHTIRTWDERDRVPPTLLDDWGARLDAGVRVVPFEIELWFHQEINKRDAAEQSVRELIEAARGTVRATTLLPEIRYHAIVGDMPLEQLPVLFDNNIRLFRAQEIQYIRPVGQAFEPTRGAEPVELGDDIDRPTPDPNRLPVIAVLDGMPAEAHSLLADRIVVDDPDDWAGGIQVSDRSHGTAMASLVCLGDLSSREAPLTRRIYIRPILRPANPPWVDERREAVPDDVSFVDIVHRAVRRLFAEAPPGVGRIAVINLSVADASRMFDRILSPCARLLDWLSWQYKVLFIVSAGNHTAPLSIDIPRDSLAQQTMDNVERGLILALEMNGIDRRLLSPAESINALTIAATYRDFSVPPNVPHRQLASNRGLPSLYNAHGFGYKRAVKPDVLFPGGRFFIGEVLGNQNAQAKIEMFTGFSTAPGQRVAVPPRTPIAASTNFSRGTSNACAMATRSAAMTFELLNAPGAIRNGDPIPDEYIAVVIKALLVHGAAWGGYRETYEATLANRYPNRGSGDYLARYFGFGEVDVNRALRCDQNKITVFGFGSLAEDQAHIYSFPLPPALSAQRVLRKLTVTLAWLTPINAAHYDYRRAHLWFSFPEANANQATIARATRSEVHHRVTTRGTVQHEIFTGEDALVFAEGREVRIWVNCRSDAGKLDDSVPYCIAVSLETPNEANIPIYQQVAARVRPRARVRPQGPRARV